MTKEEKKEISELVETAKFLYKIDPSGLALAKNTIDVLAARAKMNQQARVS